MELNSSKDAVFNFLYHPQYVNTQKSCQKNRKMICTQQRSWIQKAYKADIDAEEVRWALKFPIGNLCVQCFF